MFGSESNASNSILGDFFDIMFLSRGKPNQSDPHKWINQYCWIEIYIQWPEMRWFDHTTLGIFQATIASIYSILCCLSCIRLNRRNVVCIPLVLWFKLIQFSCIFNMHSDNGCRCMFLIIVKRALRLLYTMVHKPYRKREKERECKRPSASAYYSVFWYILTEGPHE